MSELLGVSRRTLSRIIDQDVAAELHHSAVVEQTRICLDESASRGAAAEARKAADAWLVQAELTRQCPTPFAHVRSSSRER